MAGGFFSCFLAWSSLGAGCAAVNNAAPVAPPSAAEIAGAETAVRLARQAGDQQDHAIAEHTRLAEKQLSDARGLVGRGKNREARLLLARAQVDAELSQALGRREVALADAEALERQLTEARSQSVPAAAATPEGPVPDPARSPQGALKPEGTLPPEGTP